jgi:Uncharacterized conserved protein (DUF2045)
MQNLVKRQQNGWLPGCRRDALPAVGQSRDARPGLRQVSFSRRPCLQAAHCMPHASLPPGCCCSAVREWVTHACPLTTPWFGAQVVTPVYASPMRVAVNLDSSRATDAAPAPSYPDICFAIDEFDETHHHMVRALPLPSGCPGCQPGDTTLTLARRQCCAARHINQSRLHHHILPRHHRSGTGSCAGAP